MLATGYWRGVRAGTGREEGPQLRRPQPGLKAESKGSLKKEVRLQSSHPTGTHRYLRASEKFQKLFLISPGLRREGEPQGESHPEWSTCGEEGC